MKEVEIFIAKYTGFDSFEELDWFKCVISSPSEEEPDRAPSLDVSSQQQSTT